MDQNELELGNPQPGIPSGHRLVARFYNGEVMSEPFYQSFLSRDPTGRYWVTLAMGSDYLTTPCQQWFRNITRGVEREEAINWLERELTYTVSKGDSPYGKHEMMLVRKEVARLFAGMRIQPYALPSIAWLLFGAGLFGPVAKIRPNQIPHAKIWFTDMEPVVENQGTGPIVWKACVKQKSMSPVGPEQLNLL